MILQCIAPDTWATTNVAKYSEAEIAARAQAAEDYKRKFWGPTGSKTPAWRRWSDARNEDAVREKAWKTLVTECSVQLNLMGVKGVPIFAKLGYFR